MKKAYLTYYFFLALFTFGMAVQTVLIGSHHVDYGSRMASLEQQQRQLADRVHSIEQQTAQYLSMTQLSQEAVGQGFVSIQQVVRVDSSAVVASR